MRILSSITDFPTSASVGFSIGVGLVSDMRDGKVELDASPNSFPAFPGTNEEFDHRGFLGFLGSDMGASILSEMMYADERYLFV